MDCFGEDLYLIMSVTLKEGKFKKGLFNVIDLYYLFN